MAKSLEIKFSDLDQSKIMYRNHTDRPMYICSILTLVQPILSFLVHGSSSKSIFEKNIFLPEQYPPPPPHE